LRIGTRTLGSMGCEHSLLGDEGSGSIGPFLWTRACFVFLFHGSSTLAGPVFEMTFMTAKILVLCFPNVAVRIMFRKCDSRFGF
jgi:hypothetical protein